MIYKKFNGTGKKLSELGVGTWELGGSKTDNINSIKYAIDHGVNFIDTAEIYGTEPVVGEAIKNYKRDKLFIASKVWTNHFHHDDLIKACEGSLNKLGIDYLDLYQLHWPNPDVPVEETMKAMEELMDQGKIKNIGISNFSVKQAEDAQNSMKKYEIASDQVEYSIVTRDIERSGLYDYCKKNNMAIIAYSPLSHGKIFSNKKLMDELQEIGSKYNATPSQIALAWLLHDANVFPIPKASNKNHMEDNIASAEINLDKSDYEKISALESKYYENPIASRHGMN